MEYGPIMPECELMRRLKLGYVIFVPLNILRTIAKPVFGIAKGLFRNI